MSGMRDGLIYFYFGIKYELVWETMKKELPKVKPMIKIYMNLRKENEKLKEER